MTLIPNFISTGGTLGGITCQGEYIYWADTANNNIGRAKTDGTEVDATWLSLTISPLTMDSDENYIYIGSANDQCIARADYEGNLDEAWISGISPVFVPLGIGVDDTHIYWWNTATSSIGQAAIDGTAQNNSWCTTGLSGLAAYQLEVDENYVYAASSAFTGVWRIDKVTAVGDSAPWISETDRVWGVVKGQDKIYWGWDDTDDGEAWVGEADHDGTNKVSDWQHPPNGMFHLALSENKLFGVGIVDEDPYIWMFDEIPYVPPETPGFHKGLFKLFNGDTDNGKGIDCHWMGQWHGVQTEEPVERIRRINVEYTGDMYVDLYQDLNTDAYVFTQRVFTPIDPDPLWDGGIWDGGAWDPRNPTVLGRVRPEKRGRYHAVRFRNYEGSDLKIYTAEIVYRGGKEHTK